MECFLLLWIFPPKTFSYYCSCQNKSMGFRLVRESWWTKYPYVKDLWYRSCIVQLMTSNTHQVVRSPGTRCKENRTHNMFVTRSHGISTVINIVKMMMMVIPWINKLDYDSCLATVLFCLSQQKLNQIKY